MAQFFHTPKPKPYRIEPRFWDPEKEKREARDRRIKAELGIKDDNQQYRPYISEGEFRRGLSKGRWSVHKQRRRSNARLLILVVLLGVLLYLMLR